MNGFVTLGAPAAGTPSVMESSCSFWDSCWEEGCPECGGPPPEDDGVEAEDSALWHWAIK